MDEEEEYNGQDLDDFDGEEELEELWDLSTEEPLSYFIAAVMHILGICITRTFANIMVSRKLSAKSFP